MTPPAWSSVSTRISQVSGRTQKIARLRAQKAMPVFIATGMFSNLWMLSTPSR